MRFFISFVVYLGFLFFVSYYCYAQGCSQSEEGIVTGAACSIKDLPKVEVQKPLESEQKETLNVKSKEKNDDSKKIEEQKDF